MRSSSQFSRNILQNLKWSKGFLETRKLTRCCNGPLINMISVFRRTKRTQRPKLLITALKNICALDFFLILWHYITWKYIYAKAKHGLMLVGKKKGRILLRKQFKFKELQWFKAEISTQIQKGFFFKEKETFLLERPVDFESHESAEQMRQACNYSGTESRTSWTLGQLQRLIIRC